MEDIIKQIAQIDSVADSNRENNEKILKEKRQQFELEMQYYRKEKLEKAREQAKAIYDQVLSIGEMRHSEEVQKCKEEISMVKERYKHIEQALLDKVFSQLFRVEG